MRKKVMIIVNKYTFYYVFFGHHSHFELNAYSTNQIMLNKYIDFRLPAYSYSEKNDLEIGSKTIEATVESVAETEFIKWYNQTLHPQDDISEEHRLYWFTSDNGKYICVYTEAESSYIAEAPMDSYYDGLLGETVHHIHELMYMTSLMTKEYRTELQRVLAVMEWYWSLVAIFDNTMDEFDDDCVDLVEDAMVETLKVFRPLNETKRKISAFIHYVEDAKDYRPLIDSCVEELYAIENLYYIVGDESSICIETSNALIK